MVQACGNYIYSKGNTEDTSVVITTMTGISYMTLMFYSAEISGSF